MQNLLAHDRATFFVIAEIYDGGMTDQAIGRPSVNRIVPRSTS